MMWQETVLLPQTMLELLAEAERAFGTRGFESSALIYVKRDKQAVDKEMKRSTVDGAELFQFVVEGLRQLHTNKIQQTGRTASNTLTVFFWAASAEFLSGGDTKVLIEPLIATRNKLEEAQQFTGRLA